MCGVGVTLYFSVCLPVSLVCVRAAHVCVTVCARTRACVFDIVHVLYMHEVFCVHCCVCVSGCEYVFLCLYILL